MDASSAISVVLASLKIYPSFLDQPSKFVCGSPILLRYGLGSQCRFLGLISLLNFGSHVMPEEHRYVPGRRHCKTSR